MPIKSMSEPLEPYDYAVGIENNWLPNIGTGRDNFSRGGFAVTNVMEIDAIERLQKSRPHLPARPAKRYEESDLNEWRALWVNEAYHLAKFLEPETSDYAAVQILILGSRLRAAIADGEAERAAALGALVMCYAIAEGYAPKMAAISTAHDAIQTAKTKAYLSGAGRKAKDFKNARDACIEKARQGWAANTDLRIGDVARGLRKMLLANLDKLPTFIRADIPTIETIKSWLRAAAAKGSLVIPEGAQRPGRPPKTEI